MDLARFMSDEDFALNHHHFDKVIYINLNSRPDRNRALLAGLQRLEIPHDKIIRFPAIEDSPGFVGCARSHLAVMQMAAEQQWGTVLILEDDAEFYDDEESIRRANTFLDALAGQPWDVAVLGANYFDCADYCPEEHRLTLRCAVGAHAYIVNQHYIGQMIQLFSESLAQITAGDEPDITKSIDVCWWRYMAQDRWYGLYPCLAGQTDGLSNIRGQVVAYGDIYKKSLSEICITPDNKKG